MFVYWFIKALFRRVDSEKKTREKLNKLIAKKTERKAEVKKM